MYKRQLLDFTIDKVAEHAAEWIPADAAEALLRKMERLWNEEYLYQLTPMALLNFITDYIQSVSYTHLDVYKRQGKKRYVTPEESWKTNCIHISITWARS